MFGQLHLSRFWTRDAERNSRQKPRIISIWDVVKDSFERREVECDRRWNLLHYGSLRHTPRTVPAFRLATRKVVTKMLR